MFNCASKMGCENNKCKNNDKIECMASWLILGGFIPLAIAVATERGLGQPFGNSFIPEHLFYMGVVAAGVISLLVKRASLSWQIIVAVGMLSLLAVCAIVLSDFSMASPAAIVWPLAVLLLVICQYRCDLKARNRKTDLGVALITGASSGIGLVTAKALQLAGYRVFGTSRKPASNNSEGITMLSCDVTDDASVQKMVADVLAQTGRIDLLVNNAGGGLLGGAEESSVAQAQALFDLNVFGILRVTNAVLPTMRRQGKGRIINMSSLLGLIPAPYNALYASTKHAVEGYSESLDHELRSLGIRVVLVEPGGTRTSFEGNLAKPDQPLAVYDEARAISAALMQKVIDAGDTPEIVADTVLKAATTEHPEIRYTAGKLAGRLRFMRRFLPAAFVDSGIRKFNQLPIVKTKNGCR